VLACGAAACGATETADKDVATVVRVIDGDTVELEDQRVVRYLLVDAPEVAHNSTEVDECFGPEATALNSELVLNRQVTLTYDVERQDRFERMLAYLWLDGRMVNRVLVERGYARVLVIEPNDEYAAEFEALEAEARAAGRGLWWACTP
jgi:micrococcal nuclease